MQPELFKLPFLGWPIHGFGFLMVIGFLAGIWLARRRAVQLGIDPDIVSNIGMISLIGGIGGCRLFYVIHNWQEFGPTFQSEGFLAGVWHIVNVRSGGLEFFGGLVLTLALLIGYVVWNKLPGGTLLDLTIPSLALGHGLGKIGCFLNGCCAGVVCEPDFPTAVRFPKFETTVQVQSAEGRTSEQVQVTGSEPFAVQSSPMAKDWLPRVPGVPQTSLPVHPTQLYETTGELILAGLLTAYFGWRRRPGEVTALYFLLYAPFRFILEFTRNEPRELFGHTTTVHQLVSALLFLGALTVWLWLRSRPAMDPFAVRAPAAAA